MKTELIKGMCETCGFEYQGQVISSPFPAIICPQCKHETHNFDSAEEVDAANKAEGIFPTYKVVDFGYAN
jgi:Zn finger protein HypA/HybF involved in hydrogenase expression